MIAKKKKKKKLREGKVTTNEEEEDAFKKIGNYLIGEQERKKERK